MRLHPYIRRTKLAKFQVFEKNPRFFKDLFKSTRPPSYLVIISTIVTIRHYLLIMLGTDAVAVYGFQPNFAQIYFIKLFTDIKSEEETIYLNKL